MAYKLRRVGGVIRLLDNACIPENENNCDWISYLKWLDEGNTPEPADPEPEPMDFSDINNATKILKAFALVVADRFGLTPTQLRDLIKQKFGTLQ